MKHKTIAKKLALLGMLACLTAVLSILEGALPSLPLPGMRLGLANVAVTAALWCLGPAGLVTAAVKVAVVFLTRGVTAALLALVGTLLSAAVTAALLPLYRRGKLTFVGIGVAAAAAHTVGQLGTAVALLGEAVAAYAPAVLLMSIPAGVLTGTVLNAVIPRLTPTAVSSAYRHR